MKKIILFSILIIAFLGSCTYDPYYYDPIANFSVSTDIAQPYEIIYLDNHSTEATMYFWDFGDGVTSVEPNPRHSYKNEGTYTITLTAEHPHGGTDVARLTVDVYYTELEITVAEWNEDYVIYNRVPYANVRLYRSMYDWDNEIKMVAEGTTDRNGVVIFKDLDPVNYFIDVYSTDFNNFSIREELPDLIYTDPLEKSAINTFTAWVDFAPSFSQKAARIDKSSLIIKRTPLIKNLSKGSK
jgi:hypothetical protein